MAWKEVSDEFWALVEPLLPAPKKHRIGGGRPRISDRVALNAILFVLTTGGQWKALSSTGLCAPSTAHDRFQVWRAAGVFRDLWIAGLALYDEIQGIDWR
jgi:putative transposase